MSKIGELLNNKSINDVNHHENATTATNDRNCASQYKDIGIMSRNSVDHPSHYQGNKYEVIDIIDDYNLGFNLGNAIKYILRAGKKDDYVQDLNKAIWYLQHEIESTKKKSRFTQLEFTF